MTVIDRWAGYEPPEHIVRDNWPVPGDWRASRGVNKLFRLYWDMIGLCDVAARRLRGCYEPEQPLELSPSFFDYKDFKDWFLGKYGLDAAIAVENPGWTTWTLNCTRFSKFKGTFSPAQTKFYSGWAAAALIGKPKIGLVKWKDVSRKKSRKSGVSHLSGFYIEWKFRHERCFTEVCDTADEARHDFLNNKLGDIDAVIEGEFDPDIIKRLQARKKMWEHLRKEID